MIYMGRPEIPTNMHKLRSWGGEKKEWHLMTHAPSLLHCLCLTLSFIILCNLTMMVVSVHTVIACRSEVNHLLSLCFWSIVSIIAWCTPVKKTVQTFRFGLVVLLEKRKRKKKLCFKGLWNRHICRHICTVWNTHTFYYMADECHKITHTLHSFQCSITNPDVYVAASKTKSVCVCRCWRLVCGWQLKQSMALTFNILAVIAPQNFYTPKLRHIYHLMLM